LLKTNKNKGAKKRSFYTIAIICILLLILKAPLSSLFGKIEDLLTPIQSSIYKKTEKTKDYVSNFRTYVDLINENEELLEVKLENEFFRKSLETLREENKKLRKSLEIKGYSRYNMVFANVSHKDSMSPYGEIKLDKGSNHGIKEDFPVIINGGVLGRILKVQKNSSTVELISKDGASISTLNKLSGVIGIVSGNGSKILDMNYVTVEEPVKVGDELFTSGMSQIYPKGLYIGKVHKVSQEEELFVSIKVELPFNIYDIEEVAIITKENFDYETNEQKTTGSSIAVAN